MKKYFHALVLFVAITCLMTGAAALTVQQSQALTSSKNILKTQHTPITIDKLKAVGGIGCLALGWLPPIGGACAAGAALDLGWNLADFLSHPSLQKGVDLGCSALKANIICRGISGVETVNDLLPPQPTTCADGSQPDAKGNCGTSNPPLPPQQTCPDGSVIDASATCPQPPDQQQQPPSIDCNATPDDPSCTPPSGN